MKHHHSVLFLSVLCIVLTFISVQVLSYEPTTLLATTTTSSVVVTPSSLPVPTTTAAAFIVFDVDTGTVLAEKDADTPHPIASVTKLLTAAAVLEAFNPESTTTISRQDVDGEGESGNLHPQEVYTYRELLFPLLLSSSNDAAGALLNATKGKLIDVMMQVASSSGTTHTQLADASGLSAKNVASARDLMMITRDVSTKYPFIFDVSRLPQYVGTYTGWQNNNPVSQTVGYQGGKHGYTPEAGRTLVGEFSESMETGSRTIGYILLGSSNLKNDVQQLRDFTTKVSY